MRQALRPMAGLPISAFVVVAGAWLALTRPVLADDSVELHKGKAVLKELLEAAAGGDTGKLPGIARQDDPGLDLVGPLKKGLQVAGSHHGGLVQEPKLGLSSRPPCCVISHSLLGLRDCGQQSRCATAVQSRRCAIAVQSSTLRNLSEFKITESELALIAALAIIGLSSNPNGG